MAPASAGSAPAVEPDDPGYRQGSAGYRRIRLAMFLAGFATFSTLYGVQPLMPAIGAEFGVDPGTSALTMSLPAVTLGLSMLVIGPLSEVVGRTGLIYASLVGAGATSLAAAAAGSWSIFLSLRAVQGVTLTGVAALAMAYLSEELHRQALARAAGLYVSGTAIGGMVGRFVAGGLTQLFGWRGGFAGLGLLALLCAVAVVVLLPGSRGFQRSPAALGQLLRSGLAVFRDRGIVLLFVVACLAMGSYIGVFNAVVFRLHGPPYHLSVVVVSFLFVVHVVGSASSAQAGRHAGRGRSGFRAVAPIGAAVLLCGVLLTAAGPLPLVVLGLAVVSAGFFAIHGVASPWVAARARLSSAGTSQATAGYMFFFYLGSSVFGGVAPGVWAAGGWPLVVALCGGLAAVTLLITLVLRRVPAPAGAGPAPDPPTQ